MSLNFSHSIQKAIHFLQLIILFPVFILTGLYTKAQDNSKKAMVQSSYYDAVVLYQAIKNFRGFPIKMSDEETFENNPDEPGIVRYKVIESTSGKILMDNCSSKQVDSVLQANPFSESEKENFIHVILARNANTTDTSKKNIHEIYKNNPYFKEENKTELSFLSATRNDAGLLLKEPLPFSLKGGGGITQTQILEGITEFLIEAVNKEINEAFFVHLQKALSKYYELSTLFSKSLESLNKIEITKYASSLNALKSAFEKDIKDLLSNVSRLADISKYQELVNQHPVLTLIFTTCDLISFLQDDIIPPDILYQLGTARYIMKCKSNNYSSTIKLASLISNSLRNVKIGDENTNTIGWVDKKILNMLKDNSTLFQIFMGLFAQQAGGIIFFNDNGNPMFDFQKNLFDHKDDILKTRYIVYNFSSTIEIIKSDIENARSLKKTSSSKSDFIKVYLKIANEIIGLSNNCLGILPGSVVTDIETKINTIKTEFIPLLEQANQVLTKIEEKEYSGALYETDNFLSAIFNKMQNAKVKEEYEEIRKYYIKYGIFICSVAEAKSSSDVKAAIDAIALPTGSSRIKKEKSFSFGLNAYVGIFYASNMHYKQTGLPKKEFGLTAPIGIAFNCGHFLGTGSFTFYGGIIDVGAIFTYKIDNDSSIKSDIRLGQVLSPSVGIVYGLPVVNRYNIPFSIGANYQWGPKLRSVKETGNSTLPLLTQRFNVFIAVDIPILNFHVSKQ